MFPSNLAFTSLVHGCAVPCLQAVLQRASTSSIIPVRMLGQGAYAAVDLVSMLVGTARKLLVRKRLVPSREDTDGEYQEHDGMTRAGGLCLRADWQQEWVSSSTRSHAGQR